VESGGLTIPCDILVFGGTGDLALHKLLPALYHLYREARLNNAVRIIALARRNISRNEYLKLAERHCRAQIARNDFDEDIWQRLPRASTTSPWMHRKAPTSAAWRATWANLAG